MSPNCPATVSFTGGWTLFICIQIIISFMELNEVTVIAYFLLNDLLLISDFAYIYKESYQTGCIIMHYSCS